MKKSISTILLIVCCHISFSQDWKQQLDSVMQTIENDEMFHGQVLIAEQGEIMFHKAYGKLMEEEISIDTSTSLAVKSITKAFTAAAILNLQQEGKLELDDRVNEYLENWPYKGITIRHLLSMTSGLPNFIEKAVNEADTTQYMDNSAIVDFISDNPVTAKNPGDAYNYQNSNYIILAALAEEISGMAYEVYVQKTIFDKLGMKNSYFEDLTQVSDKIDGDSFFVPSGDGNLYSTAEDLYKFEQSFYGNRILSEENKRATFSKTKLNDGSLNKYGLGWWVIDDAPETEYYIIGDGPNKRASIQRFPNTNATLIYIHNISGRYWKDVYWVVKNIWRGEAFQMPERKEGLTRYDIDVNIYSKYTGSYLTPGFGLLHISEDNGKLFLRPDPIPGKEELVPSSNITFYFQDQSVEWEFFLDEQGNVIGFGSKGKPETMGEKQ